MRQIQIRLSEPDTFDETLLSVDPKRVNVGQRYVIEGAEVKASVLRSSVGQRGRAIPIGGGTCYLTIIGRDLFHQLVCIEVDEERYILCWEATAAGRRMRANVSPVQEFEAIVNMRNPRDRLSLQRYFAPAIEALEFGVEPPADRPNANILAIVQNPPNLVVNEQAVALQPVDVNAFVLVPEEDNVGEIAEVNAVEPIQVDENDDDVVIEHEELIMEGAPANIEIENRDEGPVESVDTIETTDSGVLNESVEEEEWHEPMEEADELEGAVGGMTAEEVDA